MAIGLLAVVPALFTAVPAQAADPATITRVIQLEDYPSQTESAELPYGDGRRIWLGVGTYDWRHTIRSLGDHHASSRRIELAEGWYWWQCHLRGTGWTSPNYLAMCELIRESTGDSAFLPADGLSHPDQWTVWSGEFTWTSELTRLS
ncbi:hypothetical protein [Amycolatopsis magusensis]|uniref:hypothetical protein n=1 Tax=Amycolatopsis magusensis TaxID=882444 RepID=UPI0037ACE386